MLFCPIITFSSSSSFSSYFSYFSCFTGSQTGCFLAPLVSSSQETSTYSWLLLRKSSGKTKLFLVGGLLLLTKLVRGGGGADRDLRLVPVSVVFQGVKDLLGIRVDPM